MSPTEIVIVVILGVALLVAVPLLLLRQRATQRAQAARERFPLAKLILPGANFFGQESLGVMQLRGNGTLVLTASEIYFELWLPRREYRIPLAAVQAVEMPMSYLSKTQFRPLVKVVFRAEDGQTDSMAWLVRDVEGLKQAIETARG